VLLENYFCTCGVSLFFMMNNVVNDARIIKLNFKLKNNK